MSTFLGQISKFRKMNTHMKESITSALRLFALVCCFILTACNSLFYHPDSLNWTLPEQFTKNFEEHRIAVGKLGETIHAWHLRTDKPKKGTIVHFHGNAQNMTSHVLFVSWFLQEGFDVLTFDYRGYGKSSGEVNRENTIEDGIAVLNWIADREKNAPVLVVAQSLGGAIATVALQRSKTSNVTAVVLESTFSSYRALARNKLANFFLTWPLQWPLSYLITDTLSPDQFISGYNFPILVVHGSRDIVVPYSEGLILADLIQQESKNKVIMRTELGRGHTSCFAGSQTTHCKKAVLDFFDEALQTKNRFTGEPR